MKANASDIDSRAQSDECEASPAADVARLLRLQETVVECRRCRRLVKYCEHVAHEKVRRYCDEVYWGRPLPGFGDPHARLLIVGLAPAAHGGNRTGRMFTGDRSGDFLFAALHRAGFASQAESRHRDDGLTLQDCYITASVRCAPPGNRPTPAEFKSCRPYLVQEIRLLRQVRVVLALGRIGFDAFLQAWKEAGGTPPARKPRFAHAAQVVLPGGIVLLASYHPSQRNTQTGLLTPAMFSSLFSQVRSVLASDA